MKKSILSLAILFASVAGFSASAQTATPQCPKTKTECTKGCAKKDAPRCNPFAGLNLTEKQQSELQALRAEKGARIAENKASKDAARAEKQAQRKQNMENRLQNRRDYLAKVKNILTPEQYVQFLENSYVDQGMMKGGPRHGKMAQGHHGKKGQKGQAMRGASAPKPAASNTL